MHTTISRHNAHDLDNLCNLFEKLAIVMWNVFFLVPVGRGQLGDLLSGEEFEQVFGKIYELSHRVNFQIKTTEAMHYRRYLLQHNLEERKIGHGHGHPGSVTPARRRTSPVRPPPTPKPAPHSWATRRVNDGKGFLFISHVGNVYPSGFLPIHAGNIRETPLAEIYRNAPIFKSLRDTSKLEGKCGACEYKEICGGSPRPRLRRHRRPAGPGALLHLPAQELGPGAGAQGRGLPPAGTGRNAGHALSFCHTICPSQSATDEADAHRSSRGIQKS